MRRFTLTLHLSFVLIVIGAIVTALFSRSGRVTLYPEQTATHYERSDGGMAGLPFALRLEEFSVDYYPGSRAASDYRSEVTVIEADGRQRRETISMNHILKHRGYRFYQADYNQAAGSSTLSVSYDPWGTGIVYAGYVLLFISMVGYFFQKGSRWRAAIRALSKGAAIVMLLAASATSLPAMPGRNAGAEQSSVGWQGTEPGRNAGAEQGMESEAAVSGPRAVPEGIAAQMGGLFVYYNDRVCPLETMTRDYCLKVYGKAHWKDFSAVQVVTGWYFFPEMWDNIPVKVKLRDRGTAREYEKYELVLSGARGEPFRIFPVNTPAGLRWLPPHHAAMHEAMDGLDAALGEAVGSGDWARAGEILTAIREYQLQAGGEGLPSEARVRAEQLYNRISRPMVPFMAAITIGLILFILSAIWMSRGKEIPRSLRVPLSGGAGILALYLALVLGLYWFVSGHAPFAGSYCVMMLVSMLSALAMTLLQRRVPMILPLGYLVCGFTMLMASLSSALPKITHLMPVLNSPLLSVHVLSMMLSYTLFALVAFSGILGLCVKDRKACERLRDLSTAILYPAEFLLVAGTILGSVWANISWGNYWSWDPKETWALITILVYAVALHRGAGIPGMETGRGLLARPRAFHMYTALAFLSVLFTWFGVNLLLGGMHAYA
ncbi:MAG: cytochrome c biogenesis protein CcsA [Bacteroidales bacterium]|nr:cytochrome c biogenesis protein CcsA [Bacteroidales bacterium]